MLAEDERQQVENSKMEEQNDAKHSEPATSQRRQGKGVSAEENQGCAERKLERGGEELFFDCRPFEMRAIWSEEWVRFHTRPEKEPGGENSRIGFQRRSHLVREHEPFETQKERTSHRPHKNPRGQSGANRESQRDQAGEREPMNERRRRLRRRVRLYWD